ncbi:hypothetical protein NXT3_PB00192 (plasmid) [Sinorhizobium fredii]|uniref:Uncharacterized protein n=1 Tax=Rhizobium fredii TaxID=380 RepID=A0A2L0HBK1_RHIFR|nr:hypothetical protein NXT3_PB00192 [Sinorhizobium fredii]
MNRANIAKNFGVARMLAVALARGKSLAPARPLDCNSPDLTATETEGLGGVAMIPRPGALWRQVGSGAVFSTRRRCAALKANLTH